MAVETTKNYVNDQNQVESSNKKASVFNYEPPTQLTQSSMAEEEDDLGEESCPNPNNLYLSVDANNSNVPNLNSNQSHKNYKRIPI